MENYLVENSCSIEVYYPSFLVSNKLLSIKNNKK